MNYHTKQPLIKNNKSVSVVNHILEDRD